MSLNPHETALFKAIRGQKSFYDLFEDHVFGPFYSNFEEFRDLPRTDPMLLLDDATMLNQYEHAIYDEDNWPTIARLMEQAGADLDALGLKSRKDLVLTDDDLIDLIEHLHFCERPEDGLQRSEHYIRSQKIQDAEETDSFYAFENAESKAEQTPGGIVREKGILGIYSPNNPSRVIDLSNTIHGVIRAGYYNDKLWSTLTPDEQMGAEAYLGKLGIENAANGIFLGSKGFGSREIEQQVIKIYAKNTSSDAPSAPQKGFTKENKWLLVFWIVVGVGFLLATQPLAWALVLLPLAGIRDAYMWLSSAPWYILVMLALVVCSVGFWVLSRWNSK